MNTPRFAVVLEGGLVSAVVSNDPALIGATFAVIDYDTDGADEEEISLIDQCDRGRADALYRVDEVTKAEIVYEQPFSGFSPGARVYFGPLSEDHAAFAGPATVERLLTDDGADPDVGRMYRITGDGWSAHAFENELEVRSEPGTESP